MKEIVAWCVKRCPKDLGYADTFSSLDMRATDYYHKVLRKRIPYTEDELVALTFEDITSLPPKVQYYTLLAMIITVDCCNLSERQIIKFMNWMIDNPEVYSCGFVAWVYYNSILNDPILYPAHSVVCQLFQSGCNSYTLEFLWRAACSSDPVLINTIRVVSMYTDSKWYLPLIVYFYLCSGINEDCLNYFFSDVHRIPESEQLNCILFSTLYIWDKDTLTELIRRNYTIRSLFKILKKIGLNGIREPGIVLSCSLFPKRISSHVHFSDFRVIKGLPQIPIYYTPRQCLWNYEVHDETYKPEFIKPCDIYESWFSELSERQLDRLKEINADLIPKCEAGDFESVSTVLNSVMYNFE